MKYIKIIIKLWISGGRISQIMKEKERKKAYDWESNSKISEIMYVMQDSAKNESQSQPKLEAQSASTMV